MNRQELRELARQISEALGHEWNLREDEDDSANPAIVRPDGATIYVHLDRGRLAISGRTEHRFTPYGMSPPHITVAATKTAAAIAADIARRFLPDYLKIYRATMERQCEFEQGEVIRQDNLAALADAMNGMTRKGRVYIPSSIGSYGYAEMQEGCSGNVSFELRDISFDVALKIAAVLSGQ